VADIVSRRFPSYLVKGIDNWGFEWEEVHTIYGEHLSRSEAGWWYSKRNSTNTYPETCPTTST
jgi:hypothetical protein